MGKRYQYVRLKELSAELDRLRIVASSAADLLKCQNLLMSVIAEIQLEIKEEDNGKTSE
jgi:hypothetical protein